MYYHCYSCTEYKYSILGVQAVIGMPVLCNKYNCIKFIFTDKHMYSDIYFFLDKGENPSSLVTKRIRPIITPKLINKTWLTHDSSLVLFGHTKEAKKYIVAISRARQTWRMHSLLLPPRCNCAHCCNQSVPLNSKQYLTVWLCLKFYKLCHPLACVTWNLLAAVLKLLELEWLPPF
jgi:hypothetical protein